MKLNLGHRVKYEIEFQKITRRSSRSPDNAELISHFTLLFCRVWQRNVQKFKRTCTAIVLLIKPFVL